MRQITRHRLPNAVTLSLVAGLLSAGHVCIAGHSMRSDPPADQSRTGSALHADAPSFESVLEQLWEDFRVLHAGENPDPEVYRRRSDRLVVEALSKVDLKALTVNQYDEIVRRHMIHIDAIADQRKIIEESLTTIAAEPTPEGARAAGMVARIRGGSRGDGDPEAALRAISHPAAAELFATSHGSYLWSLCSRALAGAPLSKTLYAIGLLLKRLPDELTPEGMFGIDSLYERLAAMEDERALKLAESLRNSILLRGHARAAEMKLSGEDIWFMKLRLAFLEHAPARMTLLGSQAPDFEFGWWSGEETDIRRLSDLRGDVVALVFWASDCGFCYHAFEHMPPIVDHYEGKPIRFVSLSRRQGYMVLDYFEDKRIETPTIEEEGEATRIVMNGYNATWPFAIAEELDFQPQLGVRAVPKMIVLDHRGIVRALDMDPRQPHEKTRELLDALLKEREAGPE